MIKPLLGMLKHTAYLGLVSYLCLIMLTGCSTVEMHVIDPIAPFKLENPLINSMTLSATMVWKEKPNDTRREWWKWFEPEFQEDLQQALLTSGAAVNVQPAKQCQPGQTARTLCVTVKPFNHEEPFYKMVLGFIGGFFAACLLFIPVWFIAADIEDWVVAEVVLWDGDGKEIGRTEVKSEFEASIGFRKFNMDTFRHVYGLNNKELANRVVLELKRHPHWFEAAR